MTTFLIILGIVWIVCTVFNFYFLWKDEKENAERIGYISIKSGDLLMLIFAVIVAPIVSAVLIKIVLDQNEVLFRIPVKRRK